MAGVPITEFFGASASISGNILSIDLSELHTLVLSNDHHVLDYEADAVTPKATTVPTVYSQTDYNSASDILMLIIGRALTYTLDNPVVNNNGTLVNDRNFTIQTFGNNYGIQTNYKPSTDYKFWTCNCILYSLASGTGQYIPNLSAE